MPTADRNARTPSKGSRVEPIPVDPLTRALLAALVSEEDAAVRRWIERMLEGDKPAAEK